MSYTPQAAQELVRVAPTTANRVELASAQTNQGVMLFKREDYAASLALLQQAADAMQQIVAEAPSDAGHGQLYAQILFWLAQPLEQLGRNQEAADIYQRVVSQFRSLLARDPDNWSLKFELANKLQNLANLGFKLDASAGDFGNAAEEAVDLLRAAHAHDPSNARWRNILGAALRTRAQWWLKTGQPEALQAVDQTLRFNLDALRAYPDLNGARLEAA